MNAEKALLDAYQEWHRLVIAEGKAIRSQNWDFSTECRKARQKLQPLVDRLTHEARAQWKQMGADGALKEKKLQVRISELIDLVNHNKLLIQSARGTAKIKREQLNQAGKNLKRLQHAYVFARPAAWTSFS
jgi:hypothetical protein